MFFAKSLMAISLGLLGLGGSTPHNPIDIFKGNPPMHVHRFSASGPVGLTPAQVRAAYNLPSSGGHGTIAIVDTYDDPGAAKDLNTFSKQFGLPQCDSTNPCFTKHKMSSFVSKNSGWALEESLDIEWAHAIAPGANILLVEAGSSTYTNLLKAVDYARNRSDVVAVSMSWGGSEFSGETSYDSHFTSTHGVSFFASSGDNGTGASWPAVSPNVTAVGGTTLAMSGNIVTSETAWSGSGGGVSAYEALPSYQSAFGLTSSHRTIPDVAYDADPATGFPVYDSTAYSGKTGWWQVGGTSAGSPQWAAISALGTGIGNAKLYPDATANYAAYLRDITSGTNGTCGQVCQATTGYDDVTGLGSPLTTSF